MRKILLLAFTGIIVLLGVQKGHSQLSVNMSSVTADSSAVAAVDVTADNFKDLFGLTFSINYDSTVLKFESVTGLNTTLALTTGNFGVPGSGLVKSGQITFQWLSGASSPNLANGTKLFTLNFKAIGKKCSTSDVAISNKPAQISVVDINLNETTTLAGKKGVVTVKCGSNPPVNDCPSPACTDQTKLALIGASLTAKKDDNVCVAIRVKNFKNMQSGQGSIKWDPTILQYTEVKTPATGGIPDFNSNGFNTANAPNGEFRYIWVNPDPGKPVTLPDSTLVLELCFKVVGAPGNTGCVLIGQGQLPMVWEDINTDNLNPCVRHGKVKIDTIVANPVLLKLGSGNGQKGSTVCLGVTVENFKDMFGTNARFTWDATQLKFLRTQAYNLAGLNAAAFNNTTSSLNFLWTNPDGVVVPNGTKIFEICFELTGACDATVAIDVPGPNEFVSKVGNVLTNVAGTATGGSLKIMCDQQTLECNPGAITQPTCFGSSNGSVIMNVLNAGSDCVFQWKNSAGTNIKTGLVASGPNLTNVPAGMYSFEVFCSGVSKCKRTVTVDQPAAIVIPVTNAVTNVSCTQKGSINIGGTTGGTPPFTYAWTPAQGNIANPSNLNEGSYAVVVTDSKGCTSNASFTVTSSVTALNVSATATTVKCKGDATGSIQVTVSGGCSGYTYNWTNGLTGNNPQNLKAGTYTVTVTDSSSPAQTKTATVTINEPATPLSASIASFSDASSAVAADGKITVSVSGGTPNYSTIWAGPSTVANGTLAAVSLKAGSYAVTITDANGCSAVLSQVVGVKVIPPADTIPRFGSVAVSSNFSGFGIKCFGETNGSISAKLSGGTYPMSVVLKLGAQVIGNPKVINGPDVSFTGLGAGTYTLEATNPAGTVTSAAVTLTQPSKLAGSFEADCTRKNEKTGSITVQMNGTGAEKYTYVWSGLNDQDNLVENLEKGVYNVTVTDANGCSLTITNIEVEECTVTGDCFEASTVMTPNGDNFNDLFIINCAETEASDLNIFDRWGRLVYSQVNYDNTWQGIDKDGDPLPEGSYIWVLNVNYGGGIRDVFKGTITLLRSN